MSANLNTENNKGIPSGYSLADLFKNNALAHSDNPYIHDLNLVYQTALCQLPHRAVAFIREPSSLKEPIILLENGLVMRFEGLGDEFGNRPFDCPIVEKAGPLPATISADEFSPPTICYYIQPEVEIATKDREAVFELVRRIKTAGWKDVDLGFAESGQVGWLEMSKLGEGWLRRAVESGVLVTDQKDRALVLVDYESIQRVEITDATSPPLSNNNEKVQDSNDDVW
jgi:hypothetical protein